MQIILKEKKALEEQIKTLKERNGLEEKKTEPNLLKGSANYINKQISEKETELNNLVIGSDGWNKLKTEIESLRASLTVETKLSVGSYAYIQKELSDKKAQLNLEVVGSEKYKKLADEIKKLTEEEHKIKL